jgi:hypothetical protein
MTYLNAAGKGYRIGARMEGVLINNRFVLQELKKALPDGAVMSMINLL